VPTSYSTTASWILKAYEDAKLQVVQSLENATSKATLSFDGWTANNKVLDLLDIVTHYLDKDYFTGLTATSSTTPLKRHLNR
jgi:hypothetical protein